MSEFVSKMQGNIRKSTQDLLTFSARFLSGSLIALTLSLIVQEVSGIHENEINISFLFVIFVILLSFMRISKNWSLIGVFIFDLIFVLVGMILRLYILTAPGA